MLGRTRGVFGCVVLVVQVEVFIAIKEITLKSLK